MGTIFSSNKKSRITEQDKAVLALKKQRDQLKQYQKRINNNLEKDKELAKKLLKEGKKDRAKLLLRKKKYQEGLLDQADKQLDQLERLTQDLEFVQIEKQVLDGLKLGNDALQRANSIFSVDEIEDLLAETSEAVEKQKEIDQLLSGQLTEADEEEVLRELDAMIVEDPAALPDVPQTEPSHPITDQDLPEVPQTEPSQPITDQQPDVLEPRQPITDQLPDVPSHEPKATKTKEKVAVAAS